MFSDTFTISQIHVVCANFVKLADRKSVKLCVAYQIKKKFPLALPLWRLSGSRPKSVRASSGQYTRNIPNFIQIRSLPAEL